MYIIVHARMTLCGGRILPNGHAGVGSESTVDGAPWSLSGVNFDECVRGPPSKVAQSRPRGAPPVPTGCTICRAAVEEVAHGQGKRRNHKVAYGFEKGICLRVKRRACRRAAVRFLKVNEERARAADKTTSSLTAGTS